MSSPWLESKTPVAPPRAANPTLRQLLYAAVVTGAWAGILSLLLYLIARLFGVTVEAALRGSSEVRVITWLLVLLVPLASAVLYALAASLLRGLRHAGRIAFWAGTLVAVVTVLLPLAQPAEVPWPSRIVLAFMHVITWALVVPQVARIVGDSEPARSVDRDA
jgi:hypothetical protein